MGKREILPVKSDVVFRLFFADERNSEFLISFLKSAIDLPEDDYDAIEIADPHLLREYPGDKLGIIDIKLKTKSKKIVHVEIQLSVTPELKNRIVFYDAKLVTEQIGGGEDYGVVKRVISIVITDDELIADSPRYHHRFTLYDRDAGVEFTDLLEVHTLEMPKLPRDADGTALYDWARFINAETEEELNMLTQRNQQIGRAVVKLRELSDDEKARDLYERREKERRDAAMFLRDAERRGTELGLEKGLEKGRKQGLEQGLEQGRKQGLERGLEQGQKQGLEQGQKQGQIKIAKNLLAENAPLEMIVRVTGLTLNDVESLRDAKC